MGRAHCIVAARQCWLAAMNVLTFGAGYGLDRLGLTDAWRLRTMRRNTSRLSVDVHLVSPPLSPLDASDVVTIGDAGWPGPASVPITILGSASGSGVAPMLLTVATDGDGMSNFSGLSASSRGAVHGYSQHNRRRFVGVE